MASSKAISSAQKRNQRVNAAPAASPMAQAMNETARDALFQQFSQLLGEISAQIAENAQQEQSGTEMVNAVKAAQEKAAPPTTDRGANLQLQQRPVAPEQAPQPRSTPQVSETDGDDQSKQAVSSEHSESEQEEESSSDVVEDTETVQTAPATPTAEAAPAAEAVETAAAASQAAPAVTQAATTAAPVVSPETEQVAEAIQPNLQMPASADTKSDQKTSADAKNALPGQPGEAPVVAQAVEEAAAPQTQAASSPSAEVSEPVTAEQAAPTAAAAAPRPAVEAPGADAANGLISASPTEGAAAAPESPAQVDYSTRFLELLRDRLTKTEAATPVTQSQTQPVAAAVARVELPELQAVTELSGTRALIQAGLSKSVLEASKPQVEAARAMTQLQLQQNSALGAVSQGRETAAGNNEGSKAAAKKEPRVELTKAMERVENALREVSKSKDGKTISVRLDPPSLGSVKIDVSYRDGALHARVAAETPQVAQMLRERAHELQTMLRRSGIDAQKITVSVGGDEHSQAGGHAEAQSGRNGGSPQHNRNFRSLAGQVSTGQGSVLKAPQGSLTDHWVA